MSYSLKREFPIYTIHCQMTLKPLQIYTEREFGFRVHYAGIFILMRAVYTLLISFPELANDALKVPKRGGKVPGGGGYSDLVPTGVCR